MDSERGILSTCLGTGGLSMQEEEGWLDDSDVDMGVV
jgi:hypothetical protein